MARYLSPEWIEALDAIAGDGTVAPDDVRLVVQQEVVGGPDGDVRYFIVVDGGKAAVQPGDADEPTVTFSQDYETAVAIAAGELSAQEAFMAGRVRVRGDLAELARHQSVVAALDRAFRGVRTESGG
jgi:putative sterol carrier protein